LHLETKELYRKKEGRIASSPRPLVRAEENRERHGGGGSDLDARLGLAARLLWARRLLRLRVWKEGGVAQRLGIYEGLGVQAAHTRRR